MRKSVLQCIVASSVATLAACSTAPLESAQSTAQPLLGIQATGAGIQANDIQAESQMAASYYGVGVPNPTQWYNEEYLALTYNDDTGVTGPCVASGTSLMGWSLSHVTVAGTAGDSGTWVYQGKVAPLATWPILWGDPSITSSRNHQNYFYISNLAVSSTNSQIVNSGCVTDFNSAISGACIARSSNNAQSFSVVQCLSNNGDFTTEVVWTPESTEKYLPGTSIRPGRKSTSGAHQRRLVSSHLFRTRSLRFPRFPGTS